MKKVNDLRNKAYASIDNANGSNRLYIKLKYPGLLPHKQSTGMLDTPENREELQLEIDNMNADIKAGVFYFENAFPDASIEVKRKFSQLEQRALKHNATSVTFEMGHKRWEQKCYPNIANDSIQRDHECAMSSQIYPYFKEYRFDEITNTEIKKYFKSMKKTNDPDELVSRSRMKNVRTTLRAIWDFINEEFELKLDSPFKGINAYITTITRGKSVDAKNLDDTDLEKFEEMLDDDATKKRRPLDFVDYQAILNAYDNRRMRLATELMFLTGMIPSEVGGLLPKAVKGPNIKVRFTIIRGKLNSYPKNDHRIRDIRITSRIRSLLDEAMAGSSGRFIFDAPRGGFFNERTHRYWWEKASKAAGVEILDPYSSRHSFVAYCEVMGIYKPRIIDIMGHANKSTIDKVYGKYREALEKDEEAMKDYYGEDFWNPYKKNE